jgi:hypothetical protein
MEGASNSRVMFSSRSRRTFEDRIAGLLARKRELTEAVLPSAPMALSGGGAVRLR